jgi:hypothetical protein
MAGSELYEKFMALHTRDSGLVMRTPGTVSRR